MVRPDNLATSTPAIPTAGHYLVGQDANGQWLALSTSKLGGGVFKSRADAVHFVALETGHQVGCIAFSPVPLRMEF